MISNRTCIIPHLIHHLDFYLSLKQIIIGTSLRKITRIEQQHIFVLTALFFHKSRPTQHTCLSGQYRIREIRGKGFDTTMHVVRMKYIQFFYRLCGHHTHQQTRQTQTIYLFHLFSIFQLDALTFILPSTCEITNCPFCSHCFT